MQNARADQSRTGEAAIRCVRNLEPCASLRAKFDEEMVWQAEQCFVSGPCASGGGVINRASAVCIRLLRFSCPQKLVSTLLLPLCTARRSFLRS